MKNELMCVDSQEGFVNLEIIYRLSINRNGVRIVDYYNSFVDNIGFCPIDLRSRIISLQISRNNIIKNCRFMKYEHKFQLLNNLLNNLDSKIKNLDNRKGLVKLIKYKNNVSRLISKILKSRRNDYLIPYQEKSLIGSLFKLVVHFCPKKYYNFKEELHYFENNDDSFEFRLFTLNINDKIIPFLEQSYDLKRLELGQDEYNILMACKESMKIKDDNMSFDSYINNWAHSLLNQFKNV